jgi:hypothetical protein
MSIRFIVAFLARFYRAERRGVSLLETKGAFVPTRGDDAASRTRTM